MEFLKNLSFNRLILGQPLLKVENTHTQGSKGSPQKTRDANSSNFVLFFSSRKDQKRKKQKRLQFLQFGSFSTSAAGATKCEELYCGTKQKKSKRVLNSGRKCEKEAKECSSAAFSSVSFFFLLIALWSRHVKPSSAKGEKRLKRTAFSSVSELDP